MSRAAATDQVVLIVDSVIDMPGWTKHIWSLDFSILLLIGVLDLAAGLCALLTACFHLPVRSLVDRARFVTVAWTIFVVAATVWNWLNF
jgi:hypothetical protein